ncbi:MAG: VOC family protein [Anaerolineae bacterium]
MHKSRLGGFIIDCQTNDLADAASFWAGALGLDVRALPEEDSQRYVGLGEVDECLYVEVQAVEHASRVHLDIETDDVPAEVARLETLGARKVGYLRDWCVMEAPTGQRFCVVPAVTTQFDATARTWPDPAS